MVNICVVKNCRSRAKKGMKISLFRIPKPRLRMWVNPAVNELLKKRRDAWIRAIGKQEASISPVARVCSKHFLRGRPSEFEDVEDPDWAPSILMGNNVGNYDDHLYAKRLRLEETAKSQGMDSVNVIIVEEENYVNQDDLSYDDFDNICRVCLEFATDGHTFDQIQNELCIKMLLDLYTHIEIPAPACDDSLPQRICQKCIDFLIQLDTFRNCCRVNDEHLRKVLDSAKKQSSLQSKSPKLTKSTNALTIKTNPNDENMIFRCKSCSFICGNRRALSKHIASGEHSFLCTVCGKWDRTKNATAGKEPYRCEDCPKVLPPKPIPVDKPQLHTCEICQRQFVKKVALTSHMRMHSNEAWHKCSLCKKDFATAVMLHEHLQTHSRAKEKPKVIVMEVHSENIIEQNVVKDVLVGANWQHNVQLAASDDSNRGEFTLKVSYDRENYLIKSAEEIVKFCVDKKEK